jgi:DNA-binding transcriptional LysR family regulator
VRLLQRTTRKLTLTDAGRVFFDQVSGLVARVEDATAAIREFGTEPRGTVRLTAPPDSEQIGLGEAFASFARKYPAIHVDLTLTGRMVDLVGEGFDMAVRAGRLTDSSLIARKVGPSRLALFAAPHYLADVGVPQSLAELKRHNFILLKGQGRKGKATLRLTGPTGEESVEVSGNLSADEMTFMLHACVASAGVALLPMELAHQAVRAGKLRLVLPKYSIGGSSVYVVLPSSSLVPSRVALLRDYLVSHLERVLREAHEDCLADEAPRGRHSGQTQRRV